MAEKGHFEKGVWVVGISKDLIGKKIVRECPCDCPYGVDYSYSVIGMCGPRSEDGETCILHDIKDGCLVVEWEILPNRIHTLEKWWNDGNWIEVQ